jgi:hypothetical protein
MKSENLVNAVMNEVVKLGLANHPDVPMFKKSMERLAAEMYELIDEGEFRKARTVVSRLETTVITFVDSLWIHNHISFAKMIELKNRFHSFANAKREELWDKASRKDEEEFNRETEKIRHEFDAAYQKNAEETPIDYDEFERHIDEKIHEIYREYDEMEKSMKSSKPSTIIIIMKQ